MKINGPPKDILDTVCTYLEECKFDKVVVYIEKKETKTIRTLAQNKAFWKLFTDIGNHLGNTKEEVHDIMLSAVFGMKEVEVYGVKHFILNKNKTSELTKEEGRYFIDAILLFIKAHNLPITLTSGDLQSLYSNY